MLATLPMVTLEKTKMTDWSEDIFGHYLKIFRFRFRILNLSKDLASLDLQCVILLLEIKLFFMLLFMTKKYEKSG